MNTIYSGCIPDPWIEVAKKLQKENNIIPVYWIGWDNDDNIIEIEKEIKNNFNQCIFHGFSLAWKAIFPPETNNIRPISLDAELINKIASNELIGIKMMDRMDPDHRSFSFDERQRHFRKLLSKWLGIIDQLNIELFISASIPHRVFDYALYLACKIKGIKTLMYKITPFQDVLVPISDIDYMPETILMSYNEIKEKRETDIIILPNKILNSINLLKQSYEEAEPEYMKIQKKTSKTSYLRILIKKHNLEKLFKLFKPTKNYYKVKKKKLEETFPKLYQSMIYIYNGRKYKNKLKIYYESLCTKINIKEEKFIFVALHYQPEETTCPSAGHYVNQNLIIENLAELLPNDIKIVVKEHSSQFHPSMEGHTGREKWFYDDLLNIPQVVFVSSNDSSFNYIDNAIAVVTATGTIGWEAVVRGKPVLIFGNAWYEYCDNVFRIKSKNDINKALNKILYGELLSADYISYAKAIYKNAIQAYHYKGYDKKSQIDKNASVKNLSASVLKFLNKNNYR